MDTYVVRIYRRNEKDPDAVVGQVDLIEQEQTESFVGVDELIKILAPCKKSTQAEKPCKNRRRHSL